MYADDIKLFSRINSPLDQSNLQRDLDTVIEWAKLIDLSFNIDKFSVLTFHRGNYYFS